MNGTIEYSSPINNNSFYQLINFENGELYAVEIKTLSSDKLSDPDWIPGNACCALFALTRDEFELKDSDIEALNKLIEKLYNNIPEDRLMDAYYFTIDKQRIPMHPRPGCKTMDDNKLEKYRQRAYALEKGIPFLNSSDKVYMIYDKVTSDLLPAITWDGFATIFTKREYAENIINHGEVATLDIKEFSKSDFDEHIKTWHAFGIQKFRLNAETQDHACSILRDDYMPDPRAKEWEYNGSELCMYLWRYRQYIEYKTESMNALAQTLYNAFCHELKETLFLCPFVYDNENPTLSQPDYILHTSQGSVKLITRKALSELHGDTEILNSSNEFMVTDKNGKEVMLTGNLKFYGGEKYQLANPSNVKTAGVMNPFTVNGGENVCIPAFTDFGTLHSIFGENIRVAIYTYDELRKLAERNSTVNGIIINPNSAAMIILKKDMDMIEKISQGERKFYVPGKNADSKEQNSDKSATCEKSDEQLKKETAFCEKRGNQDIAHDELSGVKIKNNKSKIIGIVLSVILILIIIGSLAEKSEKNSSNNSYNWKEPKNTAVGTGSAKTKEYDNIDIDIDIDTDEISAMIDDLKVTQLKSFETVYVVYDADKGIDTPYCIIENSIDVSDSDKYVPNSTLNGEFVANLKTKPFSQSEFADYLTRQKSNGITEIRYWEHNRQTNGFLGNNISVDKYLEQ